MTKPQKVLISEIVRDADTQYRAINPEAVKAYAAAMKDGETLPPIKLFCENDQWYYPGDGWHRIEAAEAAGLTYVLAEVIAGTLRDAQLHALGANATHGVNRTKEDIKNIVTKALQDKEWGAWPDRMLARHIGVSPTTIGDYRALLTTGSRKKPTKAQKEESAVQVDTPEEEPDFTPEELESQPAETTKPKKNGAPVIDKAVRKAAQAALSGLIKALSSLGIYDEYLQSLSQIAERLKQI